MKSPVARWVSAACAVLLLGVGVSLSAQSDTSGETESGGRSAVLRVRLEDETINPIVARFLGRTIEQAESERAECLVVVLDTPGGLVDSTRTIVKDILASRVPVVIYVAPSGARAASAGTFITLSAHVAAMAPTTTIGAAHPVQIGGLPTSPQREPQQPSDSGADSQDGESQKKDSTQNDERDKPSTSSSPMSDKIVNSTVSWARSLAELRGRNADWAERAVRESITATETEALEQNVIDLTAGDFDALLQKLDGRKVALRSGTVTLQTVDARVRTLEMWWGEKLLATISNPNVAFLLMIFGFYGILFEFYSPGWGVAGTLGIICLILAFFGMAVLPINYVGLALIGVALALLAAEIVVTSYGALTIGGVLCLIMGALMLVDSPEGFARVSWTVIGPVAAAIGAITLFLTGSVVRAHGRKVATGGEGMVGAEGTALESFRADGDRYRGTVRVHGELWQAVSDVPVREGQALHVSDRTGLTLSVEPKADKDTSDSA